MTTITAETLDISNIDGIDNNHTCNHPERKTYVINSNEDDDGADTAYPKLPCSCVRNHRNDGLATLSPVCLMTPLIGPKVRNCDWLID